ncbi:MAG: DUF433 domain-containing protein [Bacteroidales bacterium]
MRNTRIMVFDIPGWPGSGMTYEEVLSGYPELTREAIETLVASR